MRFLQLGDRRYEIDLEQYYRLWIEEKRLVWENLYREAKRALVVDVLDVLSSMLVGNPAWVVTPENPVTDNLFSVLWMDWMDQPVDAAVRNFLTVGYAGIFFSPLGIRLVTPYNLCGVPDIFRPDFFIYVERMNVADARRLFGRLSVFDKAKYRLGSGTSATEMINRWVPMYLSAYGAEYVDIYTVYNGETFRFFCGNKPLGVEYTRKPYEDIYLLVGEERPPTSGLSEEPRKYGLPISHVEKLIGGLVPGDINVPAELENVIKATVALAKRQSLLFVRKGAVVDEQMISLLERNYRVIWVADAENAIAGTDKVTFADLQIAFNLLSEQLVSRTGVSSYQRGLPAPGINLATEAALLQANANVRVQKLQTGVLGWLTRLASAFRDWLIDLPLSEHKQVDIVADGVVYGFGEHMPYASVLMGYDIRPASGGFSDILMRRQELMSALQSMAVAPGRYDVGKVADALLRTFRLDPSALRAQPEEAVAGASPDLAAIAGGGGGGALTEGLLMNNNSEVQNNA